MNSETNARREEGKSTKERPERWRAPSGICEEGSGKWKQAETKAIEETRGTKGEREARDEQRAWKNARARKHDQSVDETIREQ